MTTRSPTKFILQLARQPITVALVVGLSGGLFLSGVWSRLGNSDSNPTEPQTQSVGLTRSFPASTVFGRSDVVVLGRDRAGMSTDVIFTVRFEDKSTVVTQIPRDTYIEADGFGSMKLNALMAYGGVEAVEKQLSRTMQRSINNHIVVNLDAIKTLADLVGGIEVNVPKRLYYVDTRQNLVIDLQQGLQVLKGNDLEGFLRWRHDASGDLGRLERQKLVLHGLIKSMQQPQNVIHLPVIVATALDLLDTDLGPIELGGLMTRLGSTTLETKTLKSTPFSKDGISYVATEWQVVAPTADQTTQSKLKQSDCGLTPTGCKTTKDGMFHGD